MSVIYPPSPLCSPVSDYHSASSNQLEISPRSSVLFSTDTELQEVSGQPEFSVDTSLGWNFCHIVYKHIMCYHNFVCLRPSFCVTQMPVYTNEHGIKLVSSSGSHIASFLAPNLAKF